MELYECEIKFRGTILANDPEAAKLVFIECLKEYEDITDHITVKETKR